MASDSNAHCTFQQVPARISRTLRCCRPRVCFIIPWSSIGITPWRRSRGWKLIGYGEFKQWIGSENRKKTFSLFLFYFCTKQIDSRSYRLTTCRARCITAQGRIMSTTGAHNHPPHVKNSSGAKMDMSTEHSVAANSQPFAQPMSNQIPNMPSATATSGMINQQQMNANMSFGAPHNNNFSMTNILNTQMSDMDPNSILSHSSAGLNQLDSNIQITPIINASIDNLQMQQQQHQRNAMNVPNMHVDTTITSANNWFPTSLPLVCAMNDNFAQFKL